MSKRYPLQFLRKITHLFSIISMASILVLSCSSSDDGGKNNPPPTDDVIRADASKINLTDEKQIIRGFGANTVFRLDFPLSNNDMDKLFGNDDGEIGLSILRIRVVPDDDTA